MLFTSHDYEAIRNMITDLHLLSGAVPLLGVHIKIDPVGSLACRSLISFSAGLCLLSSSSNLSLVLLRGHKVVMQAIPHFPASPRLSLTQSCHYHTQRVNLYYS